VRALATATVVMALTGSSLAAPAELERFRDGIAAELEAGDVARLRAIDLSRSTRSAPYALADLIARDLAPRALELAKLSDLAHRLTAHAAVIDAASAKRMEQTLRSITQAARARAPSRCPGNVPRCEPEQRSAANLTEMAAEALADLRDDPSQAAQLAIDMFESVAGSAHVMTEEAALAAARQPVLAKTRALYAELVAMVDAQGGSGGENSYLAELRQQLEDSLGSRLTARARSHGTAHVPLVLRMADHVVRELTARAFEDAGRTMDAVSLRKLGPLRDEASVRLASQRLATLPATDAVNHANAAVADALDALASPDDPDAGFGICGIVAQAAGSVLEHQSDRITAQAERSAKQYNAALALALLRRLAR
jgi:hypothetical protein